MSDLTFTTLLERYAYDCQTTLTALTSGEKAAYTHRLNEAVRWAWHYHTAWTLPDLLNADTLTLGAGALIATADIDNARHWSVWASDPRLQTSTIIKRLDAREVDGNDVFVINGAASDDVFVFWKKPLPVFTSTAVDVTETNYAAGSLVWDSSASGDVYLAIAGSADGGDLSDTAKWRTVRLPDVLDRAVRCYAMAERTLFLLDRPDRSEWLFNRAAMLLTEEEHLAREDIDQKPWLDNQNVSYVA